MVRPLGDIVTKLERGKEEPLLQDSDIKPIAKTGVTDVLVDRILGFVTAGQLRPGDRLPSERDLAERFGVSRPTVREAMRALSVLGVIEVRHGGGAFVSALDATSLLSPLNFFLGLSQVSVDQLYDARRLIEGEICALAATRITPAALDELEALITEQEKVLDAAEAYLALDSRFHARLGEVADNPFLARASQSLNVLGIEFRRAAANSGEMPRRSVRDHRQIVAALAKGDAEGARKAMIAHMDQVRNTTIAGAVPGL